MIQEFEGKTEQEAIDKAVDALGLDRNEFDVEVMENQQSGFLFKKGKVTIRVHIEDDDEVSDPENDLEFAVVEFLENVIEKMGFAGEVKIAFREEHKLGLDINSEHSAILIGRRGKNLDALQLLVNVVAGRLIDDNYRIILDSENYRIRREENLVRLAKKVGDQVRRTKGSRLLEPMNPFERRLIHTALNDYKDIETVSEGDGLYKKIRVVYKGK